MTETAPTKPAIEKLSVLIKQATPNELYLVLRNFEEGVRAGQFRAVTIDGAEFEVAHLNERGEEVQSLVSDEFVEVSDGWNTWFERTRRESRYTIMSSVGRIVTTEQRLAEQFDDFFTLAKLRRDKLNQRTAPAGKPAARPTGKTKSSETKKKFGAAIAATAPTKATAIAKGAPKAPEAAQDAAAV